VGVEDHGFSQDRGDRVLRAAVAVSVLVHVLGFFLYGIASRQISHVRFAPAPTPPPDAIVTISNAIRIEKRARPRPVPRPRPPHAARPRPAVARPQSVAAVPQPAAVPRPLAQMESAPKVRALHELDKTLQQAPPNRPRTVRATAAPHAVPNEQSREGKASQRVAFERRRTQPSRSSRLSEARIAQMNEAFDRTLSQLRRENDPLAVRTEAPAAPKRYKIQMIGVNGDLRYGQGYYYPIRSWKSDGFDYYYVSYDFTWADGTYESGGVPWPIRFRPQDDPFVNTANPALEHVPLPPPLPGWRLPPGEHVGKALRRYLPDQPQTQG
jgi:hypothetical protein